MDVQRASIMNWPPTAYVFGGMVNFTINGATDRLEFFYQMPVADTITQLGFRYGVRTGTPVQHKISLQGISSAGIPDGTILGGGSPASGLFTPPASTAWNSLVQWITLDNPIALTRGQFVSIVIEPVGTPDGSNNSSFTSDNGGGTGGTVWGFPNVQTNDAGVRTKTSGSPIFGLKSATRTYGFPIQSSVSTTVSSPDEVGFAFTVPGTGTFKLAGCRIGLTMIAGKSFNMRLYSGTTSIQGPVTFDTDLHSLASNVRMWDLWFTETDLVSLNYGEQYRVAFGPQEAAASFACTTATFASAADLLSIFGGDQIYFTSRVSGGAWTDNLAHRPAASLYLESTFTPPTVLVNAMGLVQ